MTVRNGDVTAALLSALDAAAVAVGDGEKPSAAGWQGASGSSQFVPYGVLWPIRGGMLDGPLGDPDDDADTRYQITTVGASREQAEVAADLLRAATLAASLTVTDRTVQRIRCDELGGATPDRSVEPAVWIVADRYTVLTTPTT